MLTATAQPTRTTKPTTTIRQTPPPISQPRPSFLTVLLRTLSAFAV